MSGTSGTSREDRRPDSFSAACDTGCIRYHGNDIPDIPRTIEMCAVRTACILFCPEARAYPCVYCFMSSPLHNYIRTFRRRLNLTQRQLAWLVGSRSHTLISRLERGLQLPSLRVALSLEVVLGVSIKELYRGLALDMKRLVDVRVGRARRTAKEVTKNAA